jgi:hypothetical protein
MTTKKIASFKSLSMELGIDKRTFKKMILPIMIALGDHFNPKSITPGQERLIRQFLDM